MKVPSSVWIRWFVVVCVLALAPVSAWAQGAAVDAEVVADAAAPLTDATLGDAGTGVDATASADAGPSLTLTPSGGIETFYQFNFNRPSNGITNLRGFDNRDRTITVSNIWLALDAVYSSFFGRVTLQVGHTPAMYYAAEPVSRGGGGVGDSDAVLWRNVQEAYFGMRRGRFEGKCGIFMVPIGPEGMLVKDNWNWSRSNLFVGLPFYFTGCVATANATARLTFSGWVVNGPNSVVDNNATPSGVVQAKYTGDRVTVNAVAMGGVERSATDPTGPAWRQLFDLWAEFRLSGRWTFMAHVDGGFERNRMGVSAWFAGAAYVRWHPREWIYLSARADYFREWVAQSPNGMATPIFWPEQASWMASQTVTVDVRPHVNVSLRLEYRHDQAGGNVFYRGQVMGDGSPDRPYVPNAYHQHTLTLGATAWF